MNTKANINNIKNGANEKLNCVILQIEEMEKKILKWKRNLNMMRNVCVSTYSEGRKHVLANDKDLKNDKQK